MSVARTARELTDATLIITPRYLEWLAKHGDEGYPPWVARKVANLLKTRPRVRSGSFSGSSAGSCLRAQEFTYLGKPWSVDRTVDPRLQHIYNDGKWRHLRWQAALLTASIITGIEIPVPSPEMHAMNTMDGEGDVWWSHANLAYQNQPFGLEIKGVNPFQFPRWVKQSTPIEEHMRQIHRYFLISGLELFVVIYENKGTNEWKEWVIRPQKQLLEESREELEELNKARKLKQLHPQLDSCRIHKGKNWESCHYAGIGGVCEVTKKWKG